MKSLNDEQVRSYLQQAVALAVDNSRNGRGGPFGALVVEGNHVIGTGVNSVTIDNDPTAHAEINAIRSACIKSGNFVLANCVLFASCEPCPMCFAAIYWARIPLMYFAAPKGDAAMAGFDDNVIWREMATKPADRLLRIRHVEIPNASQPFKAWELTTNKTPY